MFIKIWFFRIFCRLFLRKTNMFSLYVSVCVWVCELSMFVCTSTLFIETTQMDCYWINICKNIKKANFFFYSQHLLLCVSIILLYIRFCCCCYFALMPKRIKGSETWRALLNIRFLINYYSRLFLFFYFMFYAFPLWDRLKYNKVESLR